MKNIQFKSLLPYLGAIIIFIVLSLTFMYPLLEGKVLKQDDIKRHKGMSKEVVDYRESTGEEALWTNSMFSGMPAYQISVKYKANLLRFVDKAISMGLPRIAGFLFLYMIGFFILLKTLRINTFLSIFGSIVFAFSSYFIIIIEAGHNSKAHAIAYMAPVIAGVLLTYKRKYILGGIITLLFLALQIRAGHPQISYYLLLLLLVFGIFEFVDAIRKKEIQGFLKSTAIILFAGLLSVGTHTTNLWATYEYGLYTIRGESELSSEKENRTSGLDKDYATQWSYGIAETATLLIPDFHGGASYGDLGENSEAYDQLVEHGQSKKQAAEIVKTMPTYWGSQPFTSGPVYAGSIIIFLFVLGLFLVRGKMKWWLLTATILSITLAWGKNFMFLTELFLNYFPMYNKFRAVSMTLVIAELSIPILALLALSEVFKRDIDKEKIFKAVRNSFIIVGGFSLVFFLIPGAFFNFISPSDVQYQQSFPDWLMEAIHADRKSLLSQDAMRSLIFIVLSAGAIMLYLKAKLKRNYVFAVLIVLGIIDMWGVNKRYLNEDNFVSKSKMERPYKQTAADKQILNDKDPYYRVFNLSVDPFADASTSYFHKSVGGYHGAKLRRYQELYNHQIQQNNMNVLNMLNTKYFIQAGQNNMPIAHLNPQALGNAWFIDEFSFIENADEELEALTNFKPESTAIVDNRFAHMLTDIKFGNDIQATIYLEKYSPKHLEYRSKSDYKEVAVFSEIYYEKGWNAYIDGIPSNYFRVNYVLRAMVIPKGEHVIEFKFEPKAYYVGEKISLTSSVLLILLVIGGAFIEIKNYLKKKNS